MNVLTALYKKVFSLFSHNCRHAYIQITKDRATANYRLKLELILPTLFKFSSVYVNKMGKQKKNPQN